MPYRTTFFAAGQVYHVFNRSIDHQTIFATNRNYQRLIELIEFYRYKQPIRFSHYKRLTNIKKEEYDITISYQEPLLSILSYCVMPNHFHFLVEAKTDAGISYFMKNIQHAYSNYYNVLNKRYGPLFQGMFKAVLIETDEQLLHVSRYIHLNPTTAYIIKAEKLPTYQWSSFKDYISPTTSFVDTSKVLPFFKTPEKYKAFTEDQVDYQRQLDKIKHLILE
jgi:putative transposase